MEFSPLSHEEALRELISLYPISEEQALAMIAHLELVIEKNKEINLTRIDTFESGFLLHICDSLAALPEINDAPEGRYGDLGAGGGFPGVPLALATGRPTLLVDSVKKKIAALEEMISKLDYEADIRCHAGRIEDLARTERESFAVLTARALSSLPSLMELSSPLLQRGGRLICFKSHVSDDDLSHAVDLEKKLALRLVSDRQFSFGADDMLRRIIVFERVGFPSVKLPRRSGLAQKQPF